MAPIIGPDEEAPEGGTSFFALPAVAVQIVDTIHEQERFGIIIPDNLDGGYFTYHTGRPVSVGNSRTLEEATAKIIHPNFPPENIPEDLVKVLNMNLDPGVPGTSTKKN